MKSSKKRFSLGEKMYFFIIITVLFAVASVCTLSFVISISQIDGYYKSLTSGTAKNVASLVDKEFLKELRVVAASEEFQTLRDKAEEADDDSMVVEYLMDHGLWEKYEEQRGALINYINNMDDVKYIYAIAWGDANADHDMYLLDADDVPFYETGYYEEREAEFEGTDPTKDIEPVISNGDWGWLCSGYAAVRDEDGSIICHIGCDVSMEEVMKERTINLTYMVLSAVVCTIIILLGAVQFINRTVVRPLNAITEKMKLFSPNENGDYEEAGVINVEVKSNDEISDIYDEIRSMQIRIVDYVKNITTIMRAKERAEDDVRSKEEMIDKISEDAYKDALTGVGNKASYGKKIAEMNEAIKAGMTEFAVVMIDVNCLKIINDHHGHSAGDAYLKGICHAICDIYKHSPVYRIGGDEFVAILTGEDYRDRHARQKMLRDFFDAAYHNEAAEPYERYSAAVGMAEYASEDETVEFVFRRADKRMYEEKLKFKQQTGMEARNEAVF